MVQTGRPELVEDIPDSMLMSVARDDEHLALLRQIGFSSYMCVPLRARGKILGAITCVAADSGRRFGDADLELLEALARSAASAVDTALLFHGVEEANRTSQEALGLLDSLFVSAPVGLGFWDSDLRCVRINDCLASISGVPVDSCLGQTPVDIVGPLGEEIEALFRRPPQPRARHRLRAVGANGGCPGRGATLGRPLLPGRLRARRSPRCGSGGGRRH